MCTRLNDPQPNALEFIEHKHSFLLYEYTYNFQMQSNSSWHISISSAPWIRINQHKSTLHHTHLNSTYHPCIFVKQQINRPNPKVIIYYTQSPNHHHTLGVCITSSVNQTAQNSLVPRRNRHNKAMMLIHFRVAQRHNSIATSKQSNANIC